MSLFFFITIAAPEAPSGPIKIKDITSDSIMFDWLGPKEDGGLPVTSYNILKSENDSDWVKLDTVDNRTTSYKARDLTEGSRYNFRVVAVNKLGEGKPLDSDTVVTKKPAGRPELTSIFLGRTKLKNIFLFLNISSLSQNSSLFLLKKILMKGERFPEPVSTFSSMPGKNRWATCCLCNRTVSSQLEQRQDRCSTKMKAKSQHVYQILLTEMLDLSLAN